MTGTLLLNRYELLEIIGEGGMGIVYKAKCTLLNRFVAVKILKPELNNNDDFIKRFKREANSIASLSNPNIVNIYDVGTENNLSFIVMEYISGKTLKQIIKENSRLSPSKTLDIAMQIAKALQFAHKSNIIHRDIKPDNILINDDNLVKLTDFGIAKVVDSVTITNSNKIIGSVHYFSPEQAKGKFVDFRTDIYALGVIMYEMITGKVPFSGDTSISVAVMHIQEPVIPPKEVISDIPDSINSVILKALDKEPINRFQSAKDFWEILSAINKNINLKVNFNNNSMDTSTIIMKQIDEEFPHKKIDSTVIMTQEVISKTQIQPKNKISLDVEPTSEPFINNNAKKAFNNPNYNKKIILAAGFIALTIITYALGSYLSNGFSADTKSASSLEATVPEDNTKSTAYEKKAIPSLVGKTQEDAQNIIANNGFLLSNITSEYSSTVPKGVVINQSPAAGTYYEKNGKIDLIISQGQKVTQVFTQTNDNEKNKEKNEKEIEKAKEKEEKEIEKAKNKEDKNKKD